MKHKLIGLLVCLFCLTTLTQAEIITTTHNFDTMNVNKQIQFSEGNTVATTPLLTYTCSVDAKFGNSTNSHSQTAIFLDQPKATVTTTMIDNLKEITIYHHPDVQLLYSATTPNFYISISYDNQTWTNISDSAQIGKGIITIPMPATGDYYVQIKQRSTNFYIHTMKYTTEQCACFPYIKPE